jgi:FkbM family methyltransferase
MKTHILNRVLPLSFRTFLRQCAVEVIPSMRHLDMSKRLSHLRALDIVPRVIYDVGAAQGKWARLAHSIWPDAHILGFEPNRSNRSHLDQTKRDLSRFEYLQCFLGSHRQVINYESKGNQTSLYEQCSASGVAESAEMLVLDELIDQKRIPLPDFMKLDVQGYELEVLRGANQALKDCEAILLEVSFYREHPLMPTVDDVIEFMKAHHFRWFDVMGILRDAEHDLLWQMDLFFLKESHACWKRHI